MRAGWRLGVALLVAGLALGPAPALAQDAATDTPAADSIGPRELQDFSLQGTVTRSADPPAAATPPPPARAPAAPRQAQTERSAATSPPRTAPEQRQVEARSVAATPAPTLRQDIAEARPEPGPAPSRSSITVDLPPVGAAVTPAAGIATAFPDPEPASLAPGQGLPLWPWLLAAMMLGGGGAYLLWRRNHREALAGGPRIDAFVAPEPRPRARPPQPRAAVPAPAPGTAPPPAPGIVSTRLRPWIDLTFEPLRCIVEDERITFEFELTLRNSGSAPAREVLIEASTFNASPEQDREIQGFYDRPAGEGERIPVIPPMQSFSLRPKLTVPREQVRVLEAGGRRVFVPLVAFNAVYRWGAGGGQTSAAYLVGRDTKSEKLAPFRIDLGARVFRGLGKRALPIAVRR